MSRFFLINLIICLCLGYISYVSSSSESEKYAVLRELVKCSDANCAEESKAVKVLYKDELEKCMEKCKFGGKEFINLEEDERAQVKECFKQNGCKQPQEHMRQHENTPQFKTLQECANKNCKEQLDKMRPFWEKNRPSNTTSSSP